MLSATSTQSPLAPVSSVFTMPPAVSMPQASVAGGGAGGLDPLFLSVPGDTATTPTAADTGSTEPSGTQAT